MAKVPAPETKVRFDDEDQKKRFEEAAEKRRPSLSLNQWLLLAGEELLKNGPTPDKADKKRGGGR